MSVVVNRLSKRYGPVFAVKDASFEVCAGRVTAFLGPNGAGKTTTLRMLLGLVAPSNGEALIDGRRYAALEWPRRTVGAVLGPDGFHPGRTGRAHLRVVQTAAGFSPGRVDEVLDLVEMTEAAGQRVRSYSLGMRQRLALATALLGDPQILVADEPTNGLDPGGMAWLRAFLRSFADRGGTVLLSSHLLSEVVRTVDAVVIISGGRIRFDGSITDLAGPDGVGDAAALEAAFLAHTQAVSA